MKTSTIALVIIPTSQGTPNLIETLCDEREILLLEQAVLAGHAEPLKPVYQQRALLLQDENAFGDYVEDLLCKPFLKAEVQEHAVQWLKSKIRIEEFQKTEEKAAKIIAEFAFKLFQEDRSKTDFFLASPKNQVRIRVFHLG